MKLTLKSSDAARHFVSRAKNTVLLAGTIVLVLRLCSCNEELPLYQEPANVLEGKLKAQYILSAKENVMRVYLSVKNVYHWTFQSTAPLKGYVEIVLSRDSHIRKTDSIGAYNLVYARKYDNVNRVLTLDPGDSIRLEYTWNFIGDNAIDLPNDIFVYRQDPACPGRSIAYRETFTLIGQLLVFRETAPASFGSTFSLCYINGWPSGCYGILADSSCSYLR